MIKNIALCKYYIVAKLEKYHHHLKKKEHTLIFLRSSAFGIVRELLSPSKTSLNSFKRVSLFASKC